MKGYTVEASRPYTKKKPKFLMLVFEDFWGNDGAMATASELFTHYKTVKIYDPEGKEIKQQ